MIAARAESSRKGIEWAALGWMFLFFWYMSGVTQLLLFATDTIGWRGFRQTLLLSGLWLAPLPLSPAPPRRLAGIIGGALRLCPPRASGARRAPAGRGLAPPVTIAVRGRPNSLLISARA